jgi:hypothetical protein
MHGNMIVKFIQTRYCYIYIKPMGYKGKKSILEILVP